MGVKLAPDRDLSEEPVMTVRPVFRDRTTWLLIAGFTVLAALIGLTLTVAASQRRADAMVAHTMDVQNRLTTVLSRLQDAETGQRGYLITGRKEYLEPYDTALARLDGDLTGLASATADNPVQRTAMAQLRSLADQRLDKLKEVLLRRRSGGFGAAAALISQGQGKQLMDELRRTISRMRAEEDRLLAIRRADSRVVSDRLNLILIAGFGLLIALGVFAVRGAANRMAAVAASRDDLARANADLIAEARSRKEAEGQVRQMQKMEAVGQLTGGIAHDFNNMLSIIVGSLDLARRRLRTDPENAEVCIDNALDGARRAASLTGRLLAFSRQQPLAPVVSDPNKLVGGMSEMLRRTIGEQLRVETVLAGGVWRIHADVPQLENAILNLCVNARDAMPEGGKLTIETSNAYLDEVYAAQHEEVMPGQYVLISVSDTGVGMPPEVVERAFDPFYTTKGVGKGTGLGLSQVFGFVKQSGGHLKIYSEPGTGTVVKIYLPRWTGDPNTASQPAAPISLPLAKANEIILVVEDDPDVRHVSVDALRHLGYTVVQADSADEALKVLALQPSVDLLFTDIVMPGMTGRALSDAAVKMRPGLRTLYTTGYTRNAVVHNGVLDAGVAFLPKPFSVEQLAIKVRQVLDNQGAALRPLAGGAEAVPLDS